MSRSISLQIASSTPDNARRLLEEAIERFNAGEVCEGGTLLTGAAGDGCAMMYLWAD